jgi:SAM-dependent methyltransferase
MVPDGGKAGTVERCLCGSGDAEPRLPVGGRSLVRCRRCGLLRTAGFDPSGSLYSGDGYFAGEGGYVARGAIFRVLFESLVDRIVRLGGRGTLLDVGTGVGTLLEVARDRGFAVRGVELSEWASAHARTAKGLDVATGTLEEARFPDRSFDVVVINHVLEHVPEPGPALAEIRRILKDDGLLVVGVPNAGSLMAVLLGPRWSSWRPEQHAWHFTPATLSALVRNAGFRVVRRDARERSAPAGWGLRAIAHRTVDAVAWLAGRSESMLLFARKERGVEP